MAMSKIELRVSDVAPPTPEPPRTIYRDLLNLPDPVVLGVTIRYYNFDDVGLYFRVTGSAIGYTFGTVDLGLLASGTNAYRNLDNFGSRAKPAGEILESINLILRAYTDAAYSNLKWEYVRTVTVIWINSSDPSYTVDFLNSFDDGTVQGWDGAGELGVGQWGLVVSQDYVLSPPWSLSLWFRGPAGYICNPADNEIRARLYKTFNTPNRNFVYAIADIRLRRGPTDGGNCWPKYASFQNGTSILLFIGQPYDGALSVYPPVDKWIRLVTPLPKNTSVDVRLVLSMCSKHVAAMETIYLDDFKIISKD